MASIILPCSNVTILYTQTLACCSTQEGLSSLQAGGVAPGLLIIDDGWQVGVRTS